MYSLITHVLSWFSAPWKSPAVLEAEKRLASLESQVRENRQKIEEFNILSKNFSPLFQQMQDKYGYFLQLLQPTQRASKSAQIQNDQTHFIQRVKQMKIVVSIIMATHESGKNSPSASGPLTVLGRLLGQAQTQAHEKRIALAKLRGRMEGFKTVVGQLDQFIADTKKAHAALNKETRKVQQMGTPPMRCHSRSGIEIQSQP